MGQKRWWEEDLSGPRSPQSSGGSTKVKEVKETKKAGGNGHKTNWLQILKNHFTDIKGAGWVNENLTTMDGLLDDVKALLVDGGVIDQLIDDIKALLVDGGVIDQLLDDIKEDTNELQIDWKDGGRLDAILDLCALEATLTDIKGAGWSDENLTTIDGLLDDIKAVTENIPNAGALTALLADIASILEDTGTTLPTTLTAIVGYLDSEIADILADTGELQTDWADGGRLDAILDLCALEATLTDIKGAGWTDESLKAIKDAIDVIGGVNTYQEQIPDIHFDLTEIDAAPLAADPPGADAENSVVDIDANEGDTFVLRSLWVDVVSFGTGDGASKLTFSLWVPITDGTPTEVDSVDVDVLGIQNLMDLFGLQEVHADSIHITVVVDVEAGVPDAHCKGVYKYAKAT